MAKSEQRLIIVALTFVSLVAIALGQGSTLPLLVEAIIHAAVAAFP